MPKENTSYNVNMETEQEIHGEILTLLRGYSSYELAKKHGFVGTEEEYLASLVGEKGEVGNGIENVVLNDNYTITINYTNGDSYTIPTPIRGEKGETGNGIESATLNPDYTLTLNFTNGGSYTTPSIRGLQGERGLKGDQGIQGETGISISRVKLNPDYTLTIYFTDETSHTTSSIRGIQGEKGETGRGIEYVTVNADYSLTFKYTDGNTYNTPVLRGIQGVQGEKGDTGNGISSAVLNQDYTLTLNFTDGSSFTTSSIRGQTGERGEQGIQGEPGKGIVKTELNPDYTLTISFSDGSYYTTPSIRGERGIQGEKGKDGVDGVGISSVEMNQDYTLTINFDDGTHYTTEPIRGEKGEKGDSGDSPAITTTKSGKRTTIYADDSPIGTVDDGDDGTTPSITASKSGSVTTISVNGNPVAEINDGTPGQDGVSPSATVTQTSSGATITITDKTGTTTATVTNGQDGDDGYSPSASVSKSGSTTTITITDKTGTTTAEVHDGQGGTGTIDPTPTEGSTNAVSSGGVYDELSCVMSDLSEIPSDNVTFGVANGGLSSAGEETYDSNVIATRIRSDFIKLAQFPTTITASTGYQFRIVVYNDDFTFKAINPWETSRTISTSTVLIRILLRKTSGESITPSEFSSAIASGLTGATCIIKSSSLHTRVRNAEDRLSSLKVDTKQFTDDDYCIEQGGLSALSSGAEIDSTNNIRTGFIQFDSFPATVSVASGYSFRTFLYNDNFEYVSALNTWDTTKTFTNASYKYRLNIKKNDDSDISPADISDISLTFPEGTLCLIPSKTLWNRIVDLKNKLDTVARNNYGLNDVLTGLDNMIWSWWYYPQVVSFERVRKKIYWGYTTNDGYTGIAAYDYDTKTVTKNNLKQADVDDHNALAIYIYDDGTIVCAYAGGHNTDSAMHVRVSETPESIERFGDEIRLTCGGLTSYGQFVFYNNNLYLFYRVGNKSWAYRYSSDKGATWSAEVVVVQSSIQYYCKFMPTTSDGLVRICMYSNPSASDPNIRMGFFNLANGNIYNADNSTVLGTSNVSYSAFDTIIPVETGKTQRIFDVAITAPERPLILYGPFSTSKDCVYKIYDNGNIVTLANAGTAIWNPKYQDGCAWYGTDKIVVARESDGSDIVEIYGYENGAVNLIDTVYSEAMGSIPIRNARPVVDINGKAFLWHRGYYNSTGYTEFNTDGKMHFLTQNN